MVRVSSEDDLSQGDRYVNRLAQINSEAEIMLQNRSRYEAIEKATGVPWYVVGIIHNMEASFSFSKHFHNGDPLTDRTIQVPAGRPKKGNPPFTWEESTIDALEYDKFTGRTDWHLARILFSLERYNGFGYRKKYGGQSPYLWSCSSKFLSGRYVNDGVFDPNAESKQCGAGIFLKSLVDRGVVTLATD